MGRKPDWNDHTVKWLYPDGTLRRSYRRFVSALAVAVLTLGGKVGIDSIRHSGAAYRLRAERRSLGIYTYNENHLPPDEATAPSYHNTVTDDDVVVDHSPDVMYFHSERYRQSMELRGAALQRYRNRGGIVGVGLPNFPQPSQSDLATEIVWIAFSGQGLFWKNNNHLTKTAACKSLPSGTKPCIGLDFGLDTPAVFVKGK